MTSTCVFDCRGYGGRGLPDLTEKEKEELIAEWEPEPLGKFYAAIDSAIIRRGEAPSTFRS